MKQIISFRPELAGHFRDLNLEWLEKYFYVEDHDKELLENCQQVIIEPGGYIFFYQEGDDILGTFALIPLGDSVYELGKMAVKESARGKGIGQKMMSYCLEFAKGKPWSTLLLYSNRSLENSIHIYRKFGFQEVEIEKDNPYARGNIKMELKLI